ncbi:hypothetical protein COS21_03755 [bacterium (Candidatus Gribaldobacteria) CG02_land_8_20_14_3_00_41_15]|uniref:Uncharacterized protein n=3 Tax=Candidatus Gribaldobacteria TaxID=2798536 RepID=A0A2M7DD25_9BACT|nr:MAG: hypothetical protein COS21_03755 [bacterium (Candidatus Gribaldobacteria) CG02_land_8_20_14_3_00_41_15]
MGKLKSLKQKAVVKILESNGFARTKAGKHLTFKKKLTDGRVLTTWVPHHQMVSVFVIGYIEMVAKLFLLQFYLFGCVIVRLRKMLFAVAGLRPQNILLVFLASLENLKFRYEIVLQPSHC